MRTTYVNKAARLHSAEMQIAFETLSLFPPSFVLIFAREPIAATSITQASFRFSTSLRPSRCGDERPTRASPPLRKGENAFSTPMKSKNPTRRGTPDHVAYFANRKQSRFIEARRCELPITVGRPPASERRYEGGNLHLTDQNHAQRKEHRPCNDTPPNQRPTFPSGQPC